MKCFVYSIVDSVDNIKKYSNINGLNRLPKRLPNVYPNSKKSSWVDDYEQTVNITTTANKQ